MGQPEVLQAAISATGNNYASKKISGITYHSIVRSSTLMSAAPASADAEYTPRLHRLKQAISNVVNVDL
jgi:hypothetical protein